MTGKFIRTGLIGHPVSHSRSPLIHGYWMKQAGLLGEYTAVDIEEHDLPGGIGRLVAQGYAGFNVTVPHKENILPLCADMDNGARRIGAVNTVTIREDGSLYGYNTDVFGFVQNIRESWPSFDFAAGPAAVLGAGGAARAVVQGLIDQGVSEIRLLNRTDDRSRQLKESAAAPGKISCLGWDRREDALHSVNLLVNTTSLGMKNMPPLDLNLMRLPVTALVNDIVYAPLMTGLLNAAQLRGNKIVTGIGMLLHQARPAFQAWHGLLPEVTDELRRLVLK